MTEKTFPCFSLPPQMELMFSLALGQSPDTLPPDLDRKRFRALVEKNRITPLIAQSIGRMPAEQLEGEPELRAIRDEKNAYALICMRQIQVLASLMQAFQEKGLRVISMKGPILAMELYGNPALRYSRDLDLLVSEEEFGAACALLEGLGYEPEVTIWNKTPLRRKRIEKRGEDMHRCYHKDDICIELHWRLSFRMDESFQELWARRQMKMLMGSPIPCLGEGDELPYLVCHAAGHGFFRLRWLLDVHRLQQGRPAFFGDLYPVMAKQGTGMLLLETMLVLYRLGLPMEDVDSPLFRVRRTGDQVTFAYDEALKADADRALELTRAVWPMLTLEGEALGMAGRTYQKLLPTMGKKRTVLDLLAPCQADLELIDLPDRWYFLYYLIRPVHKLWRILRGT